jgi:hypothetical protein
MSVLYTSQIVVPSTGASVSGGSLASTSKLLSYYAYNGTISNYTSNPSFPTNLITYAPASNMSGPVIVNGIGNWTCTSKGVYAFNGWGNASGGGLIPNIYVTSFANGDTTTNANYVGIFFDSSVTTGVNRQWSATRMLNVGDVVAFQFSSTATTNQTLNIVNFAIYQLSKSA